MASLITLKETDDLAGLLEGTFRSTFFDADVLVMIEPEVSMDWIIRGSKNLYAGPCEGLGPWCSDEEYDWYF